MTREEARQHFQRIHAQVQQLPTWQQNLLRESLEPTLPEPREPVVKPAKQKAGQTSRDLKSSR